MAVLFALLFLFFPVETDAEETSLGEIIVKEPSQDPSPRLDSTLNATVISGEELTGRRTTPPEILEEIPGIRIQRYGGLDTFSTASLRGSSADQVSVYLDGLPLPSGEGGGVDLALLPTEGIERIEVYRGGSPILLGTSSMGGVISLWTKKGEGKRKTHFTSSYGSFNTLKTSLFQSQGFPSSRYAAGYEWTRSDGDFSYQDDNGTFLNPEDDRTVSRLNNELSRHNLFVNVSRDLGEGSLELQETFLREDRGVPGLGTLTSETADLSTTRSATRLQWKNRWREGHLTVGPFFQYQKQQFSDLEGGIGLGREDNDNDTYRYGLEAASSQPWGSHQRWTLAVAYSGEQFLPEDFTNPNDAPKSARNGVSLGLEDEILLVGERLLFNPSLRTEHLQSDFSDSNHTSHSLSGKIGLSFRPLQKITFKTNLARAYRIPSFSELFGDRGTFLGNPNLKDEKGLNWDIGTRLETGSLRVEVLYFLNHARDLIQIVQTSQRTARAENLSAARIQGVETSVSFSPLEWLDLKGNQTWELARDTSGLPGRDGKLLPSRPIHDLHLEGGARNRRGRLFTTLEFLDDNFLDTQNVVRVDHRIFLGAGILLHATKRILASVEAKNLLNDRVFDILGFPLPGRSYYGKVEITL